MRAVLRLAGWSVLLAGPAHAQVAEWRLSQPLWELTEDFDSVASVRSLPSGHLMVSDFGGRQLYQVDPKADRRSGVGRQGQGPGEYQLPSELLAWRGDSLLLVDRASRRLLVIGPDGRMGRTLPFPDGLGGLPDARGADRAGRVYFQASPFRGEPGETDMNGALPDSVAILRWDPASGKVDTVGRVRIPALKVQVAGGENARMVMIRPQPYAPADGWVVSEQGQVGVVREGDYHVEWLGGARATRGAPVRHDRVRVGAAEKEAVLAAMRNPRNRITVTQGGPGRGAPEARPPEPRTDDLEWPEFMPPFSSRAVLAAPGNRLWVLRSQPARAPGRVYDVFDQTGARVAVATLPGSHRVVGFAPGTVLATRTDEDGLQYLLAFRQP